MAEETNTGKTEVAPPSRRDVVTKAAQVAITAPAVAVMLNAYSKSAFAQVSAYLGDNAIVGDDFTGRTNTGDDFVTLGDDYTGP